MKAAEREKYYKAYRARHKGVVRQADGATSVHYFKLADGAMMLDPCVCPGKGVV